MFQLFDANENLLIDYNEWVDFFAEKMGLGYQERNKLANATRIVKAFSAIDENKDAMIDKEEFTENMGIVFVMVRNCKLLG
jgi:Ca2+-binding EF-hand superfamily protein